MATESGASKPALSAAQRELLARRLKGLRERPASAPETIPARPAGTPVPLSFPQEGLWLLDRLAPGDPSYNLAWRITLRGQLDVAVLDASLGAIVQRHEALRTNFQDSGESVVQRIAEQQPPALEVLDLCSVPAAERQEQATKLVMQAARHPPDLQRGPLLQLRLLRMADDLHLLVFVVHHIVFDGWSMGVFMHELANEYGARAAGAEPANESMPLQYGDFAIWQRQQLARESGRRQLDWWKQRLAGAPELLEVPSDRPRPTARTGAGGQESMLLTLAVEQALRHLAQAQQTTLFVLLFAVFKVLLWRHTGRADVVVGTPAAGRNRRELERLIGYFVNMLVVRTDVGGDPAFPELVRRMRDSVTQALDNSDVPFDRLVGELQPVRSAGSNPLFQVAFQLLEEGSGTAPRLGSLEVTCEMVPNATSKFDLTMMVNKVSQGLQLVLEYSSEMFDVQTVRRMLEHYQRLLSEVAGNPGRRLSELPLLSEAELVELSGFERGVEEASWPEQVFISGFGAAARARGQQVAVSCADRGLAYGQLDAEANRIAHALAGLGVARGSKVGLCMERSERLVAALLGIQKSGAAYVPLDPGFPAERLQYMLEDSGASVLLTADGAASHIQVPEQVRVLDLGEQAAELAAQSAADPALEIRPEDAAYVIYTSGSTGRPKGVAVSHGALGNFLRSMAREPGLNEQDVLAAVTTISFDIAGLELYLPLLVGARIELVSRQEAIDGQALAARLASSGATVLQATPATWRLLLESGWRGASGFRALCGGEVLPRQLADELLARVGELWNLYGPTETTIWSTLQRVQPGEPVTVGRPIANTQVYVLGASMERMPVGSPGEIWIGGDGVALGYHERAELTAERFVADPFSTKPGARLYRTGDLGRWTREGRLEHLGRADGQVKIRGYRIELGEIESVMERCEGVRQAAVVVRNAGTGNERLVGCVVLQQAGAAQVLAGMRARLREVLPEYMVPQELIELQAMPLTANGKVDRKLIAASIGQEVGQEAQDSTPPASATEQKVWDVFREVLEREAFGTQVSFFDLGGHSLAAARLMSRLRDAFSVDLPLRLLFEQPTVAGLARLVEERLVAAGNPELDAMPRSVVRLQPGTDSDQVPVFALPGHNGDVFCYRAFAAGLTGPLYAVQPPGVDGRELPLTDLDPLTDHLLEQIVAVRPEGSCIVMGYCAGGTVATQLARKLEARGQLKALVLIGSQHPRHYKSVTRLKPTWRWLKLRLAHHARELRATGLAGSLRYILARVRNLRSGPESSQASSAQAPDPLVSVRERIERATLHAVRAYKGGLPLHAPVRLLLPPVLWYRKPEEVLKAWSEAGTDVRALICDVSDQGDEMLQSPHVAAVLERYRQVLETL